MRIPKSAKLSLWACRGIGAVLLVLVAAMPGLLRWYQTQRPLEPASAAAILAGFYCCVPAVAAALWNLDGLMRNILKKRVLVWSNVRRISRVRWCCLAVGLVCMPAAVFYLPLVFMVVIMAFLTLVVSVLCAVMEAAVSIREENDLTI